MGEPCYDSASLYGRADAGVLGNETPLSVPIRRFLADHPEEARALFDESRLPTLVHYDPLRRLFGECDGTLLFSADNGNPLIRYRIGDTGGLISYAAMDELLGQCGLDPQAALPPQTCVVVSICPLLTYSAAPTSQCLTSGPCLPEKVAVGLEQPAIREWATGKLIMEVREDADRNPQLSIVVELAGKVQGDDARRGAVAAAVLQHQNSEFAHYVPAR